MNPFVLERIQMLPVTLEWAWEFFSNPDNLPLITPPDMDFRVTSPPRKDTYPGQIFTYMVRPIWGIRVEWTTEITQVIKPSLFVDEQRFGPYRFWHHQHHFREVAGGTEMVDIVHYLLPRLPGSTLLNKMIVSPRLRQIFDYRADALQRIAASV